MQSCRFLRPFSDSICRLKNNGTPRIEKIMRKNKIGGFLSGLVWASDIFFKTLLKKHLLIVNCLLLDSGSDDTEDEDDDEWSD